jgi:hypothetical protein
MTDPAFYAALSRSELVEQLETLNQCLYDGFGVRAGMPAAAALAGMSHDALAGLVAATVDRLTTVARAMDGFT